LGLEIGSSYNPIAAGDPALDVRTLDHLDQAGLVAKFGGGEVDTSRIQPVDYVWSGERYLDLVGETRFDWVLASHVVEHVPDFVGFLNGCAEILKPGGVLHLMVPDRRREFDYYRPCTGLGAVVDAHLQGRRLSSPGLAAEFALYMARLGGRDVWTDRDRGTPEFTHPEWVGRSFLERAQAGEYLDIHAWVFTPHSFRLLIEDLNVLELLALREAAFEATEEHEFHVQLSAQGAGPALSRQALCGLALAESRAPALAVEPPAGGQAFLEAENARLGAEVEALRASTSWRVTAPLRALRRLGGA
jgi:SAM-dependent methyltransferase